MGFKHVEEILKHPELINAKHHCDFGSPLLKREGLIVALGMHMDFNSVVKHGLQLAIRDFKRRNKAAYDSLMKQYGGELSKKKG